MATIYLWRVAGGAGRLINILIDGTVVKVSVEDQQSSKRKWDQRYAAEELEASLEPVPLVREVCASLLLCRALCLASGSGRNAVFLAQQGYKVTAVDISPVGLDRCAELARHRGVEVELIEADLLSYPFAGEFGLVTMLYYNEPRLFPRINDIVEPGGCFLFQTFSIHHAKQDWGPSNPAFLADPKAVLDAFAHWRIRRFEDGDFPVLDDATRVESMVRLVAQK